MGYFPLRLGFGIYPEKKSETIDLETVVGLSLSGNCKVRVGELCQYNWTVSSYYMFFMVLYMLCCCTTGTISTLFQNWSCKYITLLLLLIIFDMIVIGLC